MKPFRKAGVVAVGYIVAFVVASAAVAIRLANTSAPDAEASSGGGSERVWRVFHRP